ncbi:MAG: nucleotidyltransferase family protein [Mycoplasmatales bacterium]
MELNPFHNGHKYFLEQVKKKNPHSLIIALISTTVVQRGEISVLAKKIKTKLILDYVDLVIEMPLIYVNQGGEYFGYYAIKILNDLKVDKIIFGSESKDLVKLSIVAAKKNTKKQFKIGYLKEQVNELKANDILGISYLKAINKINPKLQVALIKRLTNTEKDVNFMLELSSATALRKNYVHYSKEKMLRFLPEVAYENMHMFAEQNLLNLVKINLLNIQEETIFLSEQGQLIKKIKKNVNNTQVNSLSDLAKLCSDKNNSQYKFQRIFINIILNITTDFIEANKRQSNKYKVLGFKTVAQQYLKANKNKLFFSYKEIEIENSVYKYNEKIDKLLTIYSSQDLNIINYQKPIIKK